MEALGAPFAPLERLLGVSWALLAASWAPLKRSWAPLGWSWAPLGCILALRDVPDLDFGASVTNFESPGAPILEDLSPILGKRFHSIPCVRTHVCTRAPTYTPTYVHTYVQAPSFQASGLQSASAGCAKRKQSFALLSNRLLDATRLQNGYRE